MSDTIPLAPVTEATASTVVNSNLREGLRQKIFDWWHKFSDPIWDWFERHEIGTERSRKSTQDAFAYVIWAAIWVAVTIAMRIGFQRSIPMGAFVMFITVIAVEYVAML